MSTPAPIITISNNATGWIADFGHAAPQYRDQIYRLFDTYAIPLPWTAEAEASIVQADIQQRYPEHTIRILQVPT